MKIIGTQYPGSARTQKNVDHFLGKEELMRFNQMEPLLKNNWLCGRIALKQAFLINYSLPHTYAPKITINNLPSGQPYIPEYDQLFCSIAHSNNRGTGVVSNFPIGVDLEKIKPRKKHLVEYIADKTEIAFFRSKYRNPSELITALWTIKEAVLKGLGEGFNFPPENIKVRDSENNLSMVEVLNKKELWKVVTHKVEGFFVSVAYPESIDYNERCEEIEISWFNPAIL